MNTIYLLFETYAENIYVRTVYPEILVCIRTVYPEILVCIMKEIVELKRLNRNHVPIRITGTPGIGKSTIMVYVYRELKKTKQKVMVETIQRRIFLMERKKSLTPL